MMGGVESVSRRWEELKWTKSVTSREWVAKYSERIYSSEGGASKPSGNLSRPICIWGPKTAKTLVFIKWLTGSLIRAASHFLHFYNSNIWKTCLVSGVLGPSSPNDQRPTPFLHKICGLKQSFGGGSLQAKWNYFQSPFVSIYQMFPH